MVKGLTRKVGLRGNERSKVNLNFLSYFSGMDGLGEISLQHRLCK